MQRQTGGPGGDIFYAALDTAMYDAYGTRLFDIDAYNGQDEKNRYSVGFQGQYGAYTDLETGFVLMGHRYYDPGTGRFLTRDPKGYGGGINLYGFAGNDPVNGIDPEGLDWLDNASNFSAGMGDMLSFGATGWMRQRLGVDDVVNRGSGAYVGGEVTGATVGFVDVGVGAVGAVRAVRAVRAAGGVRAFVAAGQAARVARIVSGRAAYSVEVAGLANQGRTLLNSGQDAEEVARTLYSARRALGVKYKNLTPLALRVKIYARNLKRYGDSLGPSINFLRSHGKTWEQIIESASRTGGKDLGF